MEINLAIIGSSNIVEEHLKTALHSKFKLECIYSPNSKSKNVKTLQKKYKIKYLFRDFNKFLNHSKKRNCHYIIVPKFKDNEYFLNECLKSGNKILIEKPVFSKTENFKKYLKYKSRIMVGYNRTYFKLVKSLKKVIFKFDEIIIKCPERNKSNIILNSCHLFSILIYLYPNLKIEYKKKSRHKIFCRLKQRKINISLIIYFNAIENFSIEGYNSKMKFLMSPLEKISFFDKLKKKRVENINFYSLNEKKQFNEHTVNKFKPGFLYQIQEFKKFIVKPNYNIRTNIFFSKKVISICQKIIS